MTKHSDKALTTISAMNTTPEQWKHTDILWKIEKRLVDGEVKCPTCLGGKVVLMDENGEVVKPPKAGDDYYAWLKAKSEYEHSAAAGHRERTGYPLDSFRGNCPTCKCHNSRARMYGYCTGKIPGLVEREVAVGYPQWPEGTRFDSRFGGGCSCALCNKTVVASNLVPVTGTGDDGVAHGMWIGADCAKKFLPGVHTYAKKSSRPAETKGKDIVFDQGEV